jgi:N-acetylmuramoyl-L-alanine amidase
VPVDDVLPLASGAEGDGVRDVQRRLGELGHDLGDDPSGVYGGGTSAAVKAFQDGRGLPPDGICGPVTWAALVEAGYRLGDRFLYHRTPMLRGDDVAEVQADLGVLGFDAGRVDGILGPQTARALEEFQRNSGLTPDAICGTDTVAALRRLAGRRAGPTSVAQAREAETLREAPRQLLDRRVVVGAAGSLDALADRLQHLLTEAGAVVAVLHQPDGSAQAREANEFGAELYVGLRLLAEPTCRVSFYATKGFESVGGRRLAELTAARVGTVLNIVPKAPGMRLPVLRETRMPAVLCEVGPVDEVMVHAVEVATAVAGAVAAWIEHRLD